MSTGKRYISTPSNQPIMKEPHKITDKSMMNVNIICFESLKWKSPLGYFTYYSYPMIMKDSRLKYILTLDRYQYLR